VRNKRFGHLTTATLLRYFEWNKEKLVEAYLDDPEKVSSQAGVIVDSVMPKLTAREGFMCDICCNDESGLLSLFLPCGHGFCGDCYTQYITLKITEEGESRRITCPAACSHIIDEKIVQSLVSPEGKLG
jgi:ariadne-1